MIQVEDLRKEYDGLVAVDDVSFVVGGFAFASISAGGAFFGVTTSDGPSPRTTRTQISG